MGLNDNLFRLLVVSDASSADRIRSRLPEDDVFHVVHFALTDDMPELPSGFDAMLIAVHPASIKKSIELKRLHPGSVPMAAVAENLHAYDVVRLIKAGFLEVFDLSQDLDLLREWVTSRYEEAVSAASESIVPARSGSGIRLMGESDGIRRVRDMALQAAEFSDLTVLIQGETGTGKEMVARLIHEKSGRRQGPFIEVNCAAIPETLMEAEMLGYEKGAFTDARRPKKGFFELADKGTLFLDEIGVMPPALQNKLLKVVEEKTFRRLGGESEISVDVKVLAGTNENLEKAASDGRFRPDLYYRLKVFTIAIPALRDRHQDIPLLADLFLNQVKNRYRLPISGYHPTTGKLLIQYNWPGNVRELKHVIERACVLASKGRILPNHLPDEIQNAKWAGVPVDVPKESSDTAMCIPLPTDGIAMDDIEKYVIREVMKRFGGNQSRAARYLRISRTRLIRKLSG